MVLILSTSGDVSTDLVIGWLKKHGHPYYRLNAHDLPDSGAELSLSPKRLVIGGENVPIDEINAVWFRKFGYFNRSDYYRQAKQYMSPETMLQVTQEYWAVAGGILSFFSDKYWLTKASSSQVNKLQVLGFAADCGLDVPETHIVSTRASLKKLMERGAWISKSAFEPYFIKEPEGMYSMYTKKIEDAHVEQFSESFYPSLVQAAIEKEYELRVFYLDGKCYSMAIFSQSDAQTEMDFRVYNWKKPNRNTAYQLPRDIEEKLDKLMKKLDLNCGSADILKSTDGKYYFLEVNPTGQFGMISGPCNYDLHKLVAEHLIEKDLEYGKIR